MLDCELSGSVVIVWGEWQRVAAYLLQQVERRGDLVCLPARLPYEDIAYLVGCQCGCAHCKPPDRRPCKLAVGLALDGQEPLQRDACVHEPRRAPRRRGHPSRKRSARISAAASTAPFHLLLSASRS